jgi:hypothetical protein
MREEFDAKVIATCDATTLNSESSGIIYAPDGCASISGQIGSPDNPVILVLNQTGTGSAPIKLTMTNGLFYGLIFVHNDTPDTDPSDDALVSGAGSTKIFGALVVEGNIDIQGNFTLVYDDTSVSSDTHKLPTSARFGRVAGSWLDAGTAF